MSKKEQIPLAEIKENEDLTNANDGTRSGQRKHGSSVTSISDTFVNQLTSAVRQGESFESTFLQVTKLDDLDMKESDSFQRNVFHYAVSRPDTLKTLLEKVGTKTSVQDALHQADKDGEMPIHRAAIIANTESLKILHEYDNSLIKLKTTIRKRSVLHLAVKSGSVVAVKFVLSKDPDMVNTVDSMLQSPLHYAASLNQSSVLKFLISKGGDLTLTDTNDQLALHIAASKGLKNNVALLLRESPDFVDTIDNSYRSPLLLAAQNNFPTVVSYLLSKNADYKIQDKLGLTAFDWAVSSECSRVVEVFLDTDDWKEVVSGSHHGPEGCLKVMIESMPEMAKKLLDKCVTTKGSNETRDYQVIYDFFCLEETDKNGGSCPRLEALNCMMENGSEACISHPVAVKYVDVKWRKRGFKYSLASITLNMTFHICLIIYTTLIIGEVNLISVVKEVDGKNVTKSIYKRESTPANAPGVMVLRIILLIITSGSVLKEIFQMKVQGVKYFTKTSHYYEMAMRILVYLFILHVEEELSTTHIGSGSITVLNSWLTLIQYLRVVPVLGIYIIVVQKVFYTLMKILVVVCIYLLSFSTTFYILLTEHDGFRNIYISIVSTFIAMTSGFEYEEQFVKVGWHTEIYELKMAVLILCVLVMSIVVNNALIGLAVGDTDEVMKYAKFDKFRRRAQFIIHLERSVNNISCLRMKEDKFHIEFPQRKKNLYQKVLGLLYFGSEIDAVDGGSEENEHEHEMEITLEDHIEKMIELKLENLRSSLRHDLKGIHDQIKEDRKHLEEKMEMILEKLK